jgi:hypothetical protein
MKSNRVENRGSDYAANQAEQNIHQHAVAPASHQLASEPSGDKSDDNSSEHVQSSRPKKGYDSFHQEIAITRPKSFSRDARLDAAASSPADNVSGSNYTSEKVSLLLFHRCSTAFDRAGATFCNDHLRPALAAEIEFSELICHRQFLNASWNF